MPGKKPLEPIGGITKPTIYDLTQKDICKMSAKMILYNWEEICSKLIQADAPATISQDEVFYHPMKCGDANDDTTLVGFYIMPIDSNLNNPTNKLNFFPVWQIFRNNGGSMEFGQILSNPVTLNPSAFTAGSSTPDNLDLDVIAEMITSPTFNHNHLQFSKIIGNFDRAFISYYDLFMLNNYADYIGIVGARVTSGNFLAVDSITDEERIHKSCDRQYFTYRFIGFQDVTDSIPNLPVNQIALKKVNKNTVSNVLPTAAIPAETWAVPCPPRWVPD